MPTKKSDPDALLEEACKVAADALEPLSDKQSRAVLALFSTSTVTQAAKLALVSHSTLYRWKNEDENFKRAVHAIRAGIAMRLICRAESFGAVALERLGQIVAESAKETEVIKAAKVILDTMTKLQATDLESRIGALEDRQEAVEQDWRALRDATPEELNRQFQAIQSREKDEA